MKQVAKTCCLSKNQNFNKCKQSIRKIGSKIGRNDKDQKVHKYKTSRNRLNCKKHVERRDRFDHNEFIKFSDRRLVDRFCQVDSGTFINKLLNNQRFLRPNDDGSRQLPDFADR